MIILNRLERYKNKTETDSIVGVLYSEFLARKFMLCIILCKQYLHDKIQAWFEWKGGGLKGFSFKLFVKHFINTSTYFSYCTVEWQWSVYFAVLPCNSFPFKYLHLKHAYLICNFHSHNPLSSFTFVKPLFLSVLIFVQCLGILVLNKSDITDHVRHLVLK